MPRHTEDERRTAWRWLVSEWQWPAAALFSGALLIGVAPLVFFTSPLALALVFVQLPAYLLHQAEEHLGDRFRAYVNTRLGGGREILNRTATFWINSIGVWLLILVALWLAIALGPGWGVAAGYLSLVNGIVHLAQLARFREYNPGVVTAALLLTPLGAWGVAAADASATQHAAGLALILGLHAAIVVYCVSRYRAGDVGAASGVS